MKSLIASASVAVLAFAAPALAQAQSAPTTGVYANLGYSHTSPGDLDLGAIQGRLGYRFNNWFGVEGELATGIKDDEVSVASGVDFDVGLEHQEAIYAVGFFPLTEQLELVGRVGYGNTEIESDELGTSADGQSWNFGAGAQYHFDGVNGVRVDYTRYEFEDDGDADVWSIAYSRKF